MKILPAIALAVGLGVLTPASAHNHEHDDGHHEHEKPTVVGVATRNEDFTTLVAAVEAAGLVDTLNSEGPFTVFAPINPAFEALPAGTVEALLQEENKPALQMVLTYHVVAGKVEAADLIRLIRDGNGSAVVTTVEGTPLTARIIDGSVKLEDGAGNLITVVATNVAASNGVVHVIDGVLLPGLPDQH